MRNDTVSMDERQVYKKVPARGPDEEWGRGRRLPEDALVAGDVGGGDRGGRVSTGLVPARDAQALAGRDDLVVECVLYAAVEHADAEHREQLDESTAGQLGKRNKHGNATDVVCSVRVVVYTAPEGGRRVLADVLRQEVPATRVVVEERAEIVDEAGDNDEGTLGRLLLDCIIRVRHGEWPK